jgi:hypothetical protein
MLVADRTGVGASVIDLLRRRDWSVRLQPVTLTPGSEAQWAGWSGWLVPKTELVSALQVTLHERRLQVSSALPHAATLLTELHDYRIKAPPLGNDILLAWREGPQDDHVLAVALAVWERERTRRQPTIMPFVIGYPRRTLW